MKHELLVYLLRLSLLWTLFLLTFRWAARSDRHWAWQTRTLPILYILGLVIPLLPALTLAPHAPTWLPNLAITWSGPTGSVTSSAEAPVQEGAIGWITYLAAALYLGGSLWFALRLLREASYLAGLRRTGRITQVNGLAVVYHPALTGPFTGLHYIYLPESMAANLARAALSHEAAHRYAGHAWWRLVLELSGIICWIHPLHWLLRQELHLRQEYEADAAVTQSLSPAVYGKLLLLQGVGGTSTRLPAFFSSPLKNRIEMLISPNPQRNNIYRRLLLPVVALIGLCACSDVLTQMPPNQNAFPYYTEVEEPPYLLDASGNEPNDREYQFLEQFYRLVKYPAEARATGAEAQLAVSFLITESGELEIIDIRPLTATDVVETPQKIVVVGYGTGNPVPDAASDPDLLVTEVERTLQALPQWHPAFQDGKAIDVAYSVLVNFTLK